MPTHDSSFMQDYINPNEFTHQYVKVVAEPSYRDRIEVKLFVFVFSHKNAQIGHYDHFEQTIHRRKPFGSIYVHRLIMTH